jgi:hypothetical protein
MTTANNSGNNSGNTIFIGGGGGGGGGNVTYIPNNQWVTVTIPTIAPQQFIGIDLAVPVEEKRKEKKSDGCTCKKCKEFFEYAEPNQEDGSLICWACRHGF